MAIDNNETYDLNDKTIEHISGNIYGYKLSSTSFLPVNHYSSVVYPNPELKEYLSRYAINNTIIITFIDHGYVDQLVQFYHTSIQGLHITNFIAMVDYPETRKVILLFMYSILCRFLRTSIIFQQLCWIILHTEMAIHCLEVQLICTKWIWRHWQWFTACIMVIQCSFQMLILPFWRILCHILITAMTLTYKWSIIIIIMKWILDSCMLFLLLIKI